MQSHRQALADRISAARVELKAAEKAMADAYGGPIEALSMAFRVMFGPDELRRFIRFWRGDLAEKMPVGPVTMLDLADAVASILAIAGVSKVDIKARMMSERPRRERDIDAALVDWE